MSWPSENRNPHEAYVVYDTDKNKYINFGQITMGGTQYLCHASMFPTVMQAESKIGQSRMDMFRNLVIKKVILG